MTTEKMRVRASSVISSDADTRPTPARCLARACSAVTRQSVPFRVRASRMPTVLRRAFVGASTAWAAGLPLSAYAVAAPHVAFPLALAVTAAYAVGSIACHQLPERSFHLWGAQLPVC